MQKTNLENVYRCDRPDLTIECTGGKNLGRCYNAVYYKVTSARRLLMKDLLLMREAGVLGYGQTFNVKFVDASGVRHSMNRPLGVADEEFLPPTFNEEVPCRVFNKLTGKLVDDVAMNPYTGQPYKPMQHGFYVYECENLIDSSD